jgi:hypothetical protein
LRVRAWVRFGKEPALLYLTAERTANELPRGGTSQVRLFRPETLPVPFWSRDGKTNECEITLDLAPEQIERAELHVVTWTGGAGTVRDYFTLNGHPFRVAEGSGHEVVYSKVPIKRQLLRRGSNVIRLLSDTEHHGIEVFRPGPALLVRYKP